MAEADSLSSGTSTGSLAGGGVYPEGVTLAELHVGPVSSFLGRSSKVIARVTTVLKGTRYIVHAATGWHLMPSTGNITAEPGQDIVFQLPHTDQAGWRDSSGGDYSGWAYQVTIESRASGKVETYTKTFQLVAGQTGPIELATIPDGQVGEPVSAPIATVTSILGRTGDVTEDNLRDAGLGITDADVAMYVRDIGSATGEAVNATVDTRTAEKVPPLVAEAIAADSTVAAAAAEAVTTEIAGRDILEGGPVYEDDFAFAVVDEDGRRTWIEAGDDGAPTDRSSSMIADGVAPVVADRVGLSDVDTSITRVAFAVVDEDGRRTWIEADDDGAPTPHSLDVLAPALGPRLGALTAPAEIVFPVDDWAHWGDSLTAAGWPAQMAGITGRSHYNGGWGGQNTDQIAARQGGVPTRVTVASNTIPASGSVAITSVTRGPLSNGGNRRGTIAGVLGTLSRDTAGAYTFARESAGDAVTVAPGALWIPADGETRRDRTVTIWAGRNGFKGNDPLLVVQSVQQMIDYLTPTVPRVIVMEVPPWEGEEFGVGFRPELDRLNEELRAAFRPYWLPIATWLRTPEAATFAGITFTAEDQVDIDNGITPRSLRSDAGHLNTQGNLAIAKRVHVEAQRRGWL